MILPFVVILGTCIYLFWLSAFKRSNAQSYIQRGIPLPTVIVAVHNQANNLEDFIQSLIAFVDREIEIIFVLNGCTDDSESRLKKALEGVEMLKPTFVFLPEGDKKKAIEAGVAQCKTPWFWLLDCDVRFYNSAKLSGCMDKVPVADLIIPALGIKTSNTNAWLRAIVSFEWNLLQRITLNPKSGNQAIMCNGAHLLVNTESFKTVQPYENNYEFKTGDDIFLLDAFQRAGKSVVTMPKTAWCYTESVSSYREFLKQRTRWSSKNFEFSQSHFRSAKVAIGFRMLIPFIAVLFNQQQWMSIYLFCLMVIAISESRLRSASFLLDVFCSFVLPFLYLPVIIGAVLKRFNLK